MTEWVVDLFSPIPDKSLAPITQFPSDPFDSQLKGVRT